MLIFAMACLTSDLVCLAQRIPLAQIPDPAQNVAHAQMGRIFAVEKKIRNGGFVFEVSGQKDGHEVELTLAPNGQVISAGQEMKMAELSPALQVAARKYSADAKLETIIREVEDGVTIYRLDLKRGPRDGSVELDENGIFLDEELTVSFAELPAVVQKTVRAEVGQGQIYSLGKMLESGVISFNVFASKDGRPLEFSVATNGDLEELEMVGSDLPEPAQKTIQQHIGNGRIVRATKNSEDGDVYYAVELNTGGKLRTLNIAEDGELYSAEENLTLAQTPAPVQQALASKVGEARIESVVRTTEDKVVYYEIEINRAGKQESLQFAPDGKIIEPKHN